MERKPQIQRMTMLLFWTESMPNFTNYTFLWTAFISRHYVNHELKPKWLDSPTSQREKDSEGTKSEGFHTKWSWETQAEANTNQSDKQVKDVLKVT